MKLLAILSSLTASNPFEDLTTNGYCVGSGEARLPLCRAARYQDKKSRKKFQAYSGGVDPSNDVVRVL